MQDYIVTIGGADCPLIGPPVSNAIICKVPEEPSDPEGPVKGGGLQVVVKNNGYSVNIN